jgi:hypothetical protein
MERLWYNRWRMRRLPLGILAGMSLLLRCNNYGLLDKLENPGGGGAPLKLYAFVTNQISKGDMTEFTDASCIGNGLPRADCICDHLAIANGLQSKPGGIFKAWLSGTADDMTCRLQGLSGNNCSLPVGSFSWFNTNDQLIATDFGDLFDGQLLAPVNYTETRIQKDGVQVWSGTDANGLRSNAGNTTANCSNWTDGFSTSSPILGRTGMTTNAWSAETQGTFCGAQKSIMCFAVP